MNHACWCGHPLTSRNTNKDEDLYSYYAQVLIDSGIAAKIDTDREGVPYLRDQRGRVSLIMPESGACLRCQRVVTEELLSAERTFKKNPELRKLDAETFEREYYVRGGGVRAPGIGPFTSATADNAVATLNHFGCCLLI